MEKAVKEKYVKLTVKRNFYDKTNSLKLKKAGEELTVSPDRAAFLALVPKVDIFRHYLYTIAIL